ncbi:luciferase family protein [Mucilaginibacter sp.]|uniref:luciferase domain-containing protein n=1 Tax=Mucilaginibacter sp. TaxID=1882438 RepID=UPI003D0FC5E0
MFKWIIKYLGFLKAVPLVAKVFDSQLKVWTLITHPTLLDYIDEIESKVLCWQGLSTGIHKYGGLQFNCRGRELGHIHSNGLMDILLSKKAKQQLMAEGRISDHHTFAISGWISFYIRTKDDAAYAVTLLAVAYQKINSR